MEAVWTSETLINLNQSTLGYNPGNSHHHTHYHENLKSYLKRAIMQQGRARRTDETEMWKEQEKIEKKIKV
jgi:predicted glycoside hydrolase/deacetylase ChbG (UPF0249 family)